MRDDEVVLTPADSNSVLLPLETILRRAARLGSRRGRALSVTLDTEGPAFPLNPSSTDAVARLADLEPPRRYTISGLGTQGSAGRIRWTELGYSLPRRVVNLAISLTCSLLPASRGKNALYRLAGFRIDPTAEIALSSFLDPFCPPLISIGAGTVVGAFAKVFAHAYKGGGEVIVGEVTIGEECRILGESLVGPCRIGDRSIVMLLTPTIPYFESIPPDRIVGYSAPEIRRRGERFR